MARHAGSALPKRICKTFCLVLWKDMEVHTCRLNMNFSHQSKLPLCTILQKSVAFLLIPCDSMKLSIIYIKMNIHSIGMLLFSSAVAGGCLHHNLFGGWPVRLLTS